LRAANYWDVSAWGFLLQTAAGVKMAQLCSSQRITTSIALSSVQRGLAGNQLLGRNTFIGQSPSICRLFQDVEHCSSTHTIAFLQEMHCCRLNNKPLLTRRDV